MSEAGDGGRRRSPGPSFQEILATDRSGAPAPLREVSPRYLGSEDLPRDVYFSREIHDREVASMWRRVWQMVCREADIPDVGDHVVYDIADDSLIVVRTAPEEIRAFHNSCLHRGTRLRNQGGSVSEFRCPFHGFSWSLEGALVRIPCRWDFPHVRDEDFQLPEALVETWGGFVFVNLDLEAMPLRAYLERVPEHFEAWPLERRWKAEHVAKVFDCNWKIAIEAFLETFHVLAVHPQNLAIAADANAQYDVWENGPHTSRMLQAAGLASPHVELDDPGVVEAAARLGLCEPGARLADGQSPRALIADHLRSRIERSSGPGTVACSDSEILDTIEYFVFPNLVLFGGVSPLCYRARPLGNDPERCIFEVMLLLPLPAEGERPESAAPRWLSEEERFADVRNLAHYGPVLDQDAELVPQIQRGLRSGRKTGITLGDYQEVQIRHMRQTLADYLAQEG